MSFGAPDEFRAALGILKKEISGIRGALGRIEDGLERALAASMEAAADRPEPEAIFADSPEPDEFAPPPAIEEASPAAMESVAPPPEAIFTALPESDELAPPSAIEEVPPPLDDELEQLLAAAVSRDKKSGPAAAEKAAVAAAPATDGIDALLGGLFSSKPSATPAKAGSTSSASDPERFDLSSNALEDLFGGGKAGR